MIFTSSVQLRTVARNNIGAGVAGVPVDWNKVFVTITINPKYTSKPNLSIDSAIEVIAADRTAPQILLERLQQYTGDLECKISDRWAKVLLIDSVNSPKTNVRFIKIAVNNQPRGSAA